MKFLAMVCGIEGTICEHACIWYKCLKSLRYKMDIQWSITDSCTGARKLLPNQNFEKQTNNNSIVSNHHCLTSFLWIG